MGSKLSILIATITDRHASLAALQEKLLSQIGDRDVEVLWLGDNKQRSIGLKRDALLRIAQGDYVTWVDDDDSISDNYIDEILKAIKTNPDVITFKQLAHVNGTPYEVEFKHGNENEALTWNPTHAGDVVYNNLKRAVWHTCIWKRELAVTSKFPDSSYGEDWEFCKPLQEKIKSSYYIDKILHYYYYDKDITAAPKVLD